MPIHELRTYRVASPPMMKHMHDRMNRYMIPIFREHDMKAVGAWEMTIGREMPTFLYMLEWRDLAHREGAFAEFYDDHRVEDMRQSTIQAAGGDFLRDFDVAILQPPPYLPNPFGS